MNQRDEKLMRVTDLLTRLYGPHAPFVVIVEPPGERGVSVHNLSTRDDAISVIEHALKGMRAEPARSYVRDDDGSVYTRTNRGDA